MGARKGVMHERIRLELRAAYHRTWDRSWPEDDVYLAELWGEVKTRFPDGVGSTENRRRFVLELMRECHEFTPAA